MGLVEKVCKKTVVREVEGISDCFVKEAKKDKQTEVIVMSFYHDLDSNDFTACYEWLKLSGNLGLFLGSGS